MKRPRRPVPDDSEADAAQNGAEEDTLDLDNFLQRQVVAREKMLKSQQFIAKDDVHAANCTCSLCEGIAARLRHQTQAVGKSFRSVRSVVDAFCGVETEPTVAERVARVSGWDAETVEGTVAHRLWYAADADESWRIPDHDGCFNRPWRVAGPDVYSDLDGHDGCYNRPWLNTESEISSDDSERFGSASEEVLPALQFFLDASGSSS